MTPTELREGIPALADTTYLNWGASGPSPRRVVDSVRETLEYQEYEAPGEEGMYEVADAVYESTRESVASFVGADPGEIALTQSTTDGINRVASAIDFSPGDVVVTTELEHPAGRLPWQRLERELGVEVRVIGADSGVLDLDEVADTLTGARLLCVSAVDWSYGRRQPVEALVEIAHEQGARVLVDAVQVPGQLPLDVRAWGADFVAASGHKWLLGPWGAGFLYVGESVIPDITPRHVGSRGVEEPTADPFEFTDDASRFEVGTTNPAPYAGLAAAIETISAVGLSTIRDEIETLTDRFKTGVPPDRLRSPDAYHTGLVTVQVDDPDAVVAELASESIVIRALPLPESVRVSFHVVNTAEDVDAALSALDQYWS